MTSDDLRKEVIKAIQSDARGEMLAIEIIRKISSTNKVHEFDIREEIWALIESGVLILTPDRHLRLASAISKK